MKAPNCQKHGLHDKWVRVCRLRVQLRSCSLHCNEGVFVCGRICKLGQWSVTDSLIATVIC